MEMLERDCSVMECGEEALEECQEKFYNSKQKDLEELIQLAAKSLPGEQSNRDEDIAAHSLTSFETYSQSSLASSNLEQVVTQPTTSSPRPRPLVVLDPATLNRIATGNGVRVVCSSPASPAPSGGHSLPAVAPNFRPMPHNTAAASTLASPLPTGLITLSQLLNDRTQSSFPPQQASWVRMKFTAPAQQAVHVSQTPSPTAAPRVSFTPSQVRAIGSFGQVPNVTVHPGLRRPSPYSQVRPSTPSLNTNGIPQPTGLRVRLPVPPKVPETIPPNEPPVHNAHPNLEEVQRNFAKSNSESRSNTTSSLPPEVQKNLAKLKNYESRSNTATSLPPEVQRNSDKLNSESRSSTTSCLPPADLPLLPETRPEAASDSRPRPRIGPASRIQRVPSGPSSPDSHASDMVDLTEDDQPQPTSKKAPIKEKTFPSLIVTARASLRIFTPALVNNERLIMDTQIRKVMQMPASVFTEYLLQQRLLKSEQLCKEHHQPLKLGIYSDPKRFPVSGGYVWIADCCKSGYCSVYAGSIFDKTLQSPTNIVKLMYHWACNTAVHNVLNWVKVDSYVMKTYYTFFRAVCTAVVHQKFPLLGGSFKKIQVGVISIGTYPENSTKEVKVDIMAVMDPEVPSIRLKVLENFLSDTNKVYESKFRKILEVLRDWVHPQSTVITDFAVDLGLCRQYGFANLVVSGGRQSEHNNNGVMDYMRAKIPVMFQDTLGLLSYTIIQQFLDELVWRETWGPFPSRAYESLVEHIAELTKVPGPDLLTKLKSVAAEPNKNWKYSVWDKEGAHKIEESSKVDEPVPATAKHKSFTNAESGEMKKLLLSKDLEVSKKDTRSENTNESLDRSTNSVDPAVAVPLTLIPPEQQKNSDKKIFLEPFYYGVVDGDPTRQKRSGSFLAECTLCKRDFLSASSFTNHLIHHALNNRVSKSSPDLLLNVCSICCKVVRDVDRHRKENHPYPATPRQSYMCKICRLDLGTEEKIVKHMYFVHQELDMPYRCGLCRFQTSIFDTAMSHFKDFHDKDWCVRCPYCFKIVRFCTRNGTEIANNQYYFVQHVQKHSMSKLNRKCEKCVLSFTNMATLKQHQEKVHRRSGRFLRNVRRLKLDASKMLVMSFPSQAPLPPVTLHENSFHTLKGKALSSSVVLPEYYAVCSCLECDGPMTQNHFSVKMTCTRCNFQSCCANSIREHNARRHYVPDSSSEQSSQTQIIGGPPFLEKPLYCSYCTFSSRNGNKMAAHLVNCGDGRALASSDKRKLEVLVSPRKVQRSL